MQFRPIEAFFTGLIILVALYFASPFFAVLSAVIFGTLSLGALLLSGLAELIESSKVPRYYFGYLAATVLAAAFFLSLVFVYGGFRWDGLDM